MPLSANEKFVWLVGAFAFHSVTAICIYLRERSVAILAWLGLIVLLHGIVHMPITHIYDGNRIIPPNLVRFLEALGWLGLGISSHFISYLTLDTKLYLALCFGLTGIFCWLMLFRPMATDWGLHYAVSSLLINMTIRDYGFNHSKTYIAIVLSIILVLIRLVADALAVEPPPVEEVPRHDEVDDGNQNALAAGDQHDEVVDAGNQNALAGDDDQDDGLGLEVDDIEHNIVSAATDQGSKVLAERTDHGSEVRARAGIERADDGSADIRNMDN
ncbi:hypothetical protein KY285_037115 [Solanum tuberosum]|nr:hypothetical protein KY285_037115 [Solanum tuberosum]